MIAKKIFSSFILLVALMLYSTATTAQQAPKKPAYTPIPKFKPPVVKSYLAKLTGSAAVCSAEEGKQIITLPLRVADSKDFSYKISSYQLAYKRLGVTEDEETGKASPANDLVGQRFTETPLPEIWKSNITETLHKGEELFFFDIIVFDTQGRLFFAPDLKITIQ